MREKSRGLQKSAGDELTQSELPSDATVMLVNHTENGVHQCHNNPS